MTNNGYIFFCSNSTEDECFQKMLFGAPLKSASLLQSLKPGDLVFLYNYSEKRLHGTFTALSNGQMNINPDAWDGRFPFQVKVRRIEKHEPLEKKELQSLIPLDTRGYINSVLTGDQLKALLDAFTSKYVPEYEKDFRLKYPAEHFAADGHRVRSMGEVTIDNWLYYHRILHCYETWLPITERLLCDFMVPIPNQDKRIYIEYWGLEDENYLKRRDEKLALYGKYNLMLIELNRKDLENLDAILIRKFLPFFSSEQLSK